MKQDGMYILGIDGKEIQVTDPKEAMNQAKMCVGFHEQAKVSNDPDNGVYYFEDAHKSWNHILSELQKIELKHPDLFIN